ncbi:MAG: hypothetical protein ABWY00_09510 [Dongiaceae bacterium]
MQELVRIGMMVLIGIFGVAGLFVASTGQHGLPYWGGIAFFVFCILLLFKQIVDSEKHAH